MQDSYIKLQLKETDNDNRIVEREIDGSNLIMENGEVAQTPAEIEVELYYWMEERGEDQHGSKLDLVSYSVEAY